MNANTYNTLNKTVNSMKGNTFGGKINSNNNTFSSAMGKDKSLQEYSDMDLGRIREFINILEEHQFKCEKSKKFVDAEIAKQKIVQLKQVEKDKILSDMQFKHKEEVNVFEIERNNAFSDFNTEWDKNYNELMDKFVEFEERLKAHQQDDLNMKIVEFDKKFHAIVKPTSEILNLEKILNGLIRQKEYIKAHQIQLEIDRLSVFDSNNYAIDKDKRLAKEVEKIRQKHFQEYQVLVAKKELAEAEYRKNRQLEFDKLVQGFKNRNKEITLQQSFEVMQITNPKKYNARNINSAYSSNTRMHSSASVDKIRGGGDKQKSFAI